MKDRIINIIKKLLDMDESENLDMNENLLIKGIDSLRFVEMIIQIEEEFSILFPDDKMNMFEMDTVNKIFSVVMNIYSGSQI